MHNARQLKAKLSLKWEDVCFYNSLQFATQKSNRLRFFQHRFPSQGKNKLNNYLALINKASNWSEKYTTFERKNALFAYSFGLTEKMPAQKIFLTIFKIFTTPPVLRKRFVMVRNWVKFRFKLFV